MLKDFLEIPRRRPVYRENRASDFADVEVRAGEGEILGQARRCMNCGVPFCHGYGCPLANNIPEFNAAVCAGRLEYAYKILSLTSPFPEFTSRICPALCEAACCAGLPSEPMAVKQTEFFIIENAFKNGYVKPRAPRSRNGRRIAVVGSGPSGLACADRLNELGYEVCVFEKNSLAGGLLRYGIPNFKLEKSVIDRRVMLMQEAGISFEYDVEIGRDVSLEFLKKKFAAVCLCVGAEEPRDLKIKGRELAGIHFALEFLGSQTRYLLREKDKLEISAKGKDVLIIGGGDTGSDCLGTSLRQGAKSVMQIEIMPEPPAERSPSTPWPMWEYKKRTSSSHLEGGSRMWSVESLEFLGENGNVRALKAKKLRWNFENGVPKNFEEIENSEFEIKADLVLLCMGFTGVKNSLRLASPELELTPRGVLKTGSSGATSAPKIFACGDAANGASLVVRAIASGRNLAENIDKNFEKILQ